MFSEVDDNSLESGQAIGPVITVYVPLLYLLQTWASFPGSKTTKKESLS